MRTSPATSRGAAGSATAGPRGPRLPWRSCAGRSAMRASWSRPARCSSSSASCSGVEVSSRRERTHGRGFATRAIHAGEAPDPVTHAHNTPIYATATFAFDTAAEKEDAVDRAMAGDPTAYFYSRTANPTTRALEEKLASIDGAED